MESPQASYTVAEVATLEKASRRTVYWWIQTGKVSAYRTPGGQLRILAAELDRIRHGGAA
jgi:excisionase family DNA binding protein